MNVSDHYFADVLMFFDGRPLELSLYQALFRQLEGFSVHSGLPGECFAVLLKAVGIGLGGQFTGQLCRDGGENSLAWGVELAAKLGILWAALPLFQQLLQWLDTLLRM